MIPNTNEDVEKSDHLCTAGNAKGMVILENSYFVIKLNNALTTRPSNHTLLHLSQRNEHSHSHKMCTQIFIKVIHNSQEMETSFPMFPGCPLILITVEDTGSIPG